MIQTMAEWHRLILGYWQEVIGGRVSADRIAAECRKVRYKMHYLRDMMPAIAATGAIFLAGERSTSRAHTVADRKSAYRYAPNRALSPRNFNPSSDRPFVLFAEKSRALSSPLLSPLLSRRVRSEYDKVCNDLRLT